MAGDYRASFYALAEKTFGRKFTGIPYYVNTNIIQIFIPFEGSLARVSPQMIFESLSARKSFSAVFDRTLVRAIRLM